MSQQVKVPPRPEIIKKHCNTCQKIHSEIPVNARVWIDEGVFLGWMWECDGMVRDPRDSGALDNNWEDCKSTLFVKN